VGIEEKIVTVLVAGAAGGLGRALISHVGRSPRNVIAVCRDSSEADALRKSVDFGQAKVTIVPCNLADGDAVASLGQKFPEVDAIINAAGGFAWVPIHKAGVSDLKIQLEANLLSTWNLMTSFVPHMMERGFGRLVFVSSRSTTGSGAAGLGPYLAAKTGINMLVQTLAEEVKDYDINVNAVLPTIIDNPQNRAAMPDADPKKWVTADGLAEFILTLLSRESRHVNGALIPVAGRV
jgi:NAD(P)-dependent dehydrogenase (short-subunit alcohol dehydrogenase family)